MQEYYSSGKLLITGEYLVLEGATALAIPTIKGQSLSVEQIQDNSSIINWQAYDSQNQLWFQCKINYLKEEVLQTTNPELSSVLLSIFKVELVKTQLNQKLNSYQIQTHLEFHKDWGLGTSSTLINNIAQWLNIDAYLLQKQTFKSSGYDIACAQNKQPLLYTLQNDSPSVELTQLQEEITPHLFYIYSNRKQNSRDAMNTFREKKFTTADCETISSISFELTQTKDIELFQEMVKEHNAVLENILDTPAVPQVFNDFEGTIKPLGAWGGDFLMAISHSNPISYFQNKGFHTVLSYTEMFY